MALTMTFQVMGQFNTPSSFLEKHVNTLASDALLGRGFGTPQGKLAAEYIAQQMEDAGIAPLHGSYLHPFSHREGILNIPGVNVAGIIPGNDPLLKGEFIVLGAHFDHLGWMISQGDTVVYNGADDNASGSATIIEIGRNLADNQASLGRSVVIVAFDGEESGLIGSTWFVENSIIPPHQIKLMFSIDMVGMYNTHRGLDMVGVKMLTDYEHVVGELAGEYGITVTKANKSVGQRTDTAPFGNIGIPAIHAYTGLESPYHKPGDTASKLDYEGMAKVADFVSSATLYLSTVPSISDLPALDEDAGLVARTKKFRSGVRVNMGTGYHNFKDEAYRGKTIVAFEAGVFGNIQLTRLLMIQPELLYETKGSQSLEGNIRTSSITTPLNLLLATPDEGFVRAYVQVGGYYSYHFGGSQGGASLDYEETYNRNELGLTYGIGMEAMNVQLGLYYQSGLTNLLHDSEGVKVTNQNFYVMLGVMF